MIVAMADNFGLSYLLEVVGLIIVVWFVIKKFPGPLVARMMNAKLAEIRTQLSAGEEAASAAQSLVEQRTAALEAAKVEAEAIVEQARRGAELVRSEGDRVAAEEYERLVVRAGNAIEAARSAVRTDILGRIGSIIAEATSEVVDAELDAPTQRRLVDEAIVATEAEAS